MISAPLRRFNWASRLTTSRKLSHPKSQRSDVLTPLFLCKNAEEGGTMATWEQKKNIIRTQILNAASIYKNKLAGKVFLYVCGNDYFEVAFLTDRFLHLTGVKSNLRAQDFYEKANDSTLALNQFSFDNAHSYRNAKKKAIYLAQLPALTDSLVCVLRDMNTASITYKLGMTNINFTIGLTEHTDASGTRLSDWYLPRTLRVNDNAIENSADADFADFIFSKSASEDKYDTVMYADKEKQIPEIVTELLSEELKETLRETQR